MLQMLEINFQVCWIFNIKIVISNEYSSSSLINIEKDLIRKIDHDKIRDSFANMPTLQKI